VPEVLEDQIARLVAESEVRRTIADYCQSCDDGRHDEFAACFTPDAVVHLMGKRIEGREAIAAWIAAAQPAERRGKHVTINPLVRVDVTQRRATGETDYLFVARRDGRTIVTTAGRYSDAFVPHEDRWLIERREISFLGAPPG